VRQLIHQRGNQDFFDCGFLLVAQLTEASSIATEFADHNLGQELLYFNDGGSDIKRAQLFDESLDLCVNYRFSLAGFGLAFADIYLDDRIEVQPTLRG